MKKYFQYQMLATLLFACIFSQQAYAEIIFECVIIKVNKIKSNREIYSVGNKFELNLRGNQAWSNPFGQGLLFLKETGAYLNNGHYLATYIAKGFNMLPVELFLQEDKNRTVTMVAIQNKIRIDSACKDITQMRLSQKTSEMKNYAEQQFSTDVMAKGFGWYVLLINDGGYTYKTMSENFQNIPINESAALFRLPNKANSEDTGWYTAFGPYSERDDALDKKRELRGQNYHPDIIKIIPSSVVKFETRKGSGYPASTANSFSPEDINNGFGWYVVEEAFFKSEGEGTAVGLFNGIYGKEYQKLPAAAFKLSSGEYGFGLGPFANKIDVEQFAEKISFDKKLLIRITKENLEKFYERR